MPIPGFCAGPPSLATTQQTKLSFENRPSMGEADRITAASCFGDCMQECISDPGISKGGCTQLCTLECGGKPADNPPYQCTPTDNSVNHTLCTTAIDAWQKAAEAICTTTLGGIPVAGVALVAACKQGVASVATQSKATCPPAMICI